MTNQAENVTRIQELTRRYAQYSRSHSGLGAVWGGCCMALFGVMTLLSDRYDYLVHLVDGGRPGFWRFLLKQPSSSKPLFMFIGLGVPVLWLLGRAGIQKFVYERRGVVIPAPTEENARQLQQSRALEYLSLLLIPLLWLRFFLFQPREFSGVLAATGLLILLPLACRRIASLLDRTMAYLIFLAGAALLSGVRAESTLVLILAYSAMGVFQLGKGIKTHLQFRKVCRELDAAQKEEA